MLRDDVRNRRYGDVRHNRRHDHDGVRRMCLRVHVCDKSRLRIAVRQLNTVLLPNVRCLLHL